MSQGLKPVEREEDETFRFAEMGVVVVNDELVDDSSAVNCFTDVDYEYSSSVAIVGKSVFFKSPTGIKTCDADAACDAGYQALVFEAPTAPKLQPTLFKECKNYEESSTPLLFSNNDKFIGFSDGSRTTVADILSGKETYFPGSDGVSLKVSSSGKFVASYDGNSWTVFNATGEVQVEYEGDLACFFTSSNGEEFFAFASLEEGEENGQTLPMILHPLSSNGVRTEASVFVKGGSVTVYTMESPVPGLLVLGSFRQYEADEEEEEEDEEDDSDGDFNSDSDDDQSDSADQPLLTMVSPSESGSKWDVVNVGLPSVLDAELGDRGSDSHPLQFYFQYVAEWECMLVAMNISMSLSVVSLEDGVWRVNSNSTVKLQSSAVGSIGAPSRVTGLSLHLHPKNKPTHSQLYRCPTIRGLRPNPYYDALVPESDKYEVPSFPILYVLSSHGYISMFAVVPIDNMRAAIQPSPAQLSYPSPTTTHAKQRAAAPPSVEAFGSSAAARSGRRTETSTWSMDVSEQEEQPDTLARLAGGGGDAHEDWGEEPEPFLDESNVSEIIKESKTQSEEAEEPDFRNNDTVSLGDTTDAVSQFSGTPGKPRAPRDEEPEDLLEDLLQSVRHRALHKNERTFKDVEHYIQQLAKAISGNDDEGESSEAKSSSDGGRAHAAPVREIPNEPTALFEELERHPFFDDHSQGGSVVDVPHDDPNDPFQINALTHAIDALAPQPADDRLVPRGLRMADEEVTTSLDLINAALESLSSSVKDHTHTLAEFREDVNAAAGEQVQVDMLVDKFNALLGNEEEESEAPKLSDMDPELFHALQTAKRRYTELQTKVRISKLNQHANSQALVWGIYLEEEADLMRRMDKFEQDYQKLLEDDIYGTKAKAEYQRAYWLSHASSSQPPKRVRSTQTYHTTQRKTLKEETIPGLSSALLIPAVELAGEPLPGLAEDEFSTPSSAWEAEADQNMQNLQQAVTDLVSKSRGMRKKREEEKENDSARKQMRAALRLCLSKSLKKEYRTVLSMYPQFPLLDSKEQRKALGRVLLKGQAPTQSTERKLEVYRLHLLADLAHNMFSVMLSKDMDIAPPSPVVSPELQRTPLKSPAAPSLRAAGNQTVEELRRKIDFPDANIGETISKPPVSSFGGSKWDEGKVPQAGGADDEGFAVRSRPGVPRRRPRSTFTLQESDAPRGGDEKRTDVKAAGWGAPSPTPDDAKASTSWGTEWGDASRGWSRQASITNLSESEKKSTDKASEKVGDTEAEPSTSAIRKSATSSWGPAVETSKESSGGGWSVGGDATTPSPTAKAEKTKDATSEKSTTSWGASSDWATPAPESGKEKEPSGDQAEDSKTSAFDAGGWGGKSSGAEEDGAGGWGSLTMKTKKEGDSKVKSEPASSGAPTSGWGGKSEPQTKDKSSGWGQLSGGLNLNTSAAESSGTGFDSAGTQQGASAPEVSWGLPTAKPEGGGWGGNSGWSSGTAAPAPAPAPAPAASGGWGSSQPTFSQPASLGTGPPRPPAPASAKFLSHPEAETNIQALVNMYKEAGMPARANYDKCRTFFGAHGPALWEKIKGKYPNLVHLVEKHRPSGGSPAGSAWGAPQGPGSFGGGPGAAPSGGSGWGSGPDMAQPSFGSPAWGSGPGGPGGSGPGGPGGWNAGSSFSSGPTGWGPSSSGGPPGGAGASAQSMWSGGGGGNDNWSSNNAGTGGGGSGWGSSGRMFGGGPGGGGGATSFSAIANSGAGFGR